MIFYHTWVRRVCIKIEAGASSLPTHAEALGGFSIAVNGLFLDVTHESIALRKHIP